MHRTKLSFFSLSYLGNDHLIFTPRTGAYGRVKAGENGWGLAYTVLYGPLPIQGEMTVYLLTVSLYATPKMQHSGRGFDNPRCVSTIIVPEALLLHYQTLLYFRGLSMRGLGSSHKLFLFFPSKEGDMCAHEA